MKIESNSLPFTETQAEAEAGIEGGCDEGKKRAIAPEAGKSTVYVLVRSDISLAQQVVQASHAAAEMGRRFYRPHHGIASLIVLTVPDKAALMAARRHLSLKAIAVELFFEPDFDIGESAMASEPVSDIQRRYFSSWPLWKPVFLEESAIA